MSFVNFFTSLRKNRSRPSPRRRSLSGSRHTRRLDFELCEQRMLLSFSPGATATKVDSLLVDNDGDGVADPGDTIRYTVTITSGVTMNNTAYADTIDSNTTLVPGSVKVLPLALDDSYVIATGGTLNIPASGVLSNDIGSPAPSVSAIDGSGAYVGAAYAVPGGGTLTAQSDGSFVFYAPAVAGPVTFTYDATNTGGTDTATVTINVQAPPSAVNDAPAATSVPGDDYHTATDTLLDSTGNYSLLDNDTPAVPVVSYGPTTGSETAAGGTGASAQGGTVIVQANGEFTYFPPAGYIGYDTFVYKIQNGVGSDTATATIAVGVRPTANDDNYDVIINGFLSIAAPGVLSNDTGSPTLTVTQVQGSDTNVGVATAATGGGSVTLNANGSFLFNAPAATGPVTFTYQASNPLGASNTATVTINVKAAPVANDDGPAGTSVPGDPFHTGMNQFITGPTAYSVLGNDSGFNPLSVVSYGVIGNEAIPTNSTATTQSGSISLNASGNIVNYTPPTNFVGYDTFNYTMTSGVGGSDTATTTIAVGVRPTANPDSFDVDAIITAVDNPLNNDIGSLIVVQSYCGGILAGNNCTTANGGTLNMGDDGFFTYKPAEDYTGTDTVNYVISNGLGTSNANITFNIEEPGGCSALCSLGESDVSVLSGENINVPVGDIPAGKSVVIVFDVTIDSTIPATTVQVSNQGSVTWDTGSIVTDDPDTIALDDPTITPVPQADLSITKTDSPDPVETGGQVTYTLTVKNAGPSDAQGVTINDPLPVGTTLAGTSGGCAEDPNGIPTCTIGTLSSGNTATITVVLNVTTSGTISNTATVSSTTHDPNVDGNESDTEETSTVPAAPDGLSATANGTSQIDLSWSDNSSDETGFRIERSLTGAAGTFAEIDSVGAGGASVKTYSDTTVTCSNRYYYQVRAERSGTYSAYSNVDNATTDPCAPSSLIQAGSTATSIDLSWTDNSDDETKFHIDRAPDGITFGEIATTVADDTTFTDSGGPLACGQSWSYQVRAERSGVYSAYSDPLRASTGPCVPTVSANGPYKVAEGGSKGLSATGNDPQGDPLTYDWDLDNNGIYETTNQQNPTFSAVGFNGPTSQIVNVRACDPTMDCGFDSATVTIDNADPDADAGTDKTDEKEGDLLAFSGSFTDPASGAGETYTISWDFDDGSPAVTGTLTPSHVYSDNGIYTVTLTVTDDDGGSDSDTLTVTVKNVDPEAHAGLDQTINGSYSVNVSGSFSDPGTGDTHTIDWDWDDGSPHSTGTLTPSHTYAADGIYTVTLTVTDDDGGSDSDTLTVTITNFDFGDAPATFSTTLASNGARHLAVGPMLGTNRDTETDGQPTNAADRDDTTGTPDDEDGVALAANLFAGLPAAATVTVTLGTATSARLDAWIDFNLDGDWFEAGERITPAGGLPVINGTNTVPFVVPATAGTGSTYARFRLSTAGGLLPSGLANDGEVEDYAIVINALAPQSCALVDDPVDLGKTALVCMGTSGNDQIEFKDSVEVFINGKRIGKYAPTGGLYAFGGAGNDDISLDTKPTHPAYLAGGPGNDKLRGDAGNDQLRGDAGNDKLEGRDGDDLLFGGDANDELRGGKGHDILLGEAGDDKLFGEDGNDLLIGGIGKDVLEGGAGKNAGHTLLIGGTTDHDANVTALEALRDEWILGDPISDRVAHLTGATAGGLNSPYLLRHDNLTTGGGTVHDDGLKDELKGSSAVDWLFQFALDELRLSPGDLINHAPL